MGRLFEHADLDSNGAIDCVVPGPGLRIVLICFDDGSNTVSLDVFGLSYFLGLFKEKQRLRGTGFSKERPKLVE